MYGDRDVRVVRNGLSLCPACVNVDITCDNFHIFPFLSMSCTFLIDVCGHSSRPNVRGALLLCVDHGSYKLLKCPKPENILAVRGVNPKD